jgi:CubicO group peptidase (beta-lactamase class C family)
MKIKRVFKRIVWLVIIIALGYGIRYCWLSFPIISGYGAKNMCSAVFVAGRNEEQERKQELGFFPMSLGTFTVDYKDSSVTGTVFGLGREKAIYRKGLGATLISELTEAQVRAEQFHLATAPNISRDSVAWPMGNKMDENIPANVDKAKLQKAIDDVFAEKDTTHLIRTRAVIVLYNGKIIAEKYAEGFSKDTKLMGWSMTKSITSALLGILVKDGKLNIDVPAPVPEWSDANDPRHAITIKNLMQQSSGLQFDEDYAKSSDATQMLFQKADMAAFTASHKLQDKPGTVFYYSSGNSNILSRIIRQTVGENEYHAFPYDSLFYKLGMYSAVIEPDASGTFVGSSYMYATARDWARFGLLYLQNGMYNNQQILPDGWVKQTATPATSTDNLQGQYGLQFWLNTGQKNNAANRTYPHVPADMFCADGFEGQNIFIIPSKNLVVVRLGLTQHGHYDADDFLAELVDAVK